MHGQAVARVADFPRSNPARQQQLPLEQLRIRGERVDEAREVLDDYVQVRRPGARLSLNLMLGNRFEDFPSAV
jgi:hypothetical protein